MLSNRAGCFERYVVAGCSCEVYLSNLVANFLVSNDLSHYRCDSLPLISTLNALTCCTFVRNIHGLHLTGVDDLCGSKTLSLEFAAHSV